MKVVRGIATIDDRGELTMHVPGDLPPGQHTVTLTLLDNTTSAAELPPLPLLDIDLWPIDLSLRREDLYGDWRS